MPTISPISELSIRYGKYLGKNGKGIKLFKKTEASGETILTAIKSGELYKKVSILPDYKSPSYICKEIKVYNYFTNIKTKSIQEMILENGQVIRNTGHVFHDMEKDGKVIQYVLPEKFFDIEPPKNRVMVGVKKYNDRRIYKAGYLLVAKEREINPDGTFNITTNVFADGFVMPSGVMRYADFSRTKTYSSDGKLLNCKSNRGQKAHVFQRGKSGNLTAGFYSQDANIAKALANEEKVEKRSWFRTYGYI